MKNSEEFIRYGKSSKDIASHKQVFFNENDALLSEATKINKLYLSQPKRILNLKGFNVRTVILY